MKQTEMKRISRYIDMLKVSVRDMKHELHYTAKKDYERGILRGKIEGTNEVINDLYKILKEA